MYRAVTFSVGAILTVVGYLILSNVFDQPGNQIAMGFGGGLAFGFGIGLAGLAVFGDEP